MTPPRKRPSKRPARTRRTVRVRIDGQDYRASIALVKPLGRRSFVFTPELLKRATSHSWFWALERPVADALAQALLDVGAVEGFKTGSELVAHLREKYN